MGPFVTAGVFFCEIKIPSCSILKGVFSSFFIIFFWVRFFFYSYFGLRTVMGKIGSDWMWMWMDGFNGLDVGCNTS